jgi:glutaredoxin 2
MKLFVYDHCPFCVKARAIFGLKGVPLSLAILLNDDEATPISMIGKKMAPILEQDGRFIGESMEIVAYIDGLSGERILSPPQNPAVAQWLRVVSEPLFRLALPRWVSADLKEFSTPEARIYFTRKKEAMIGSFKDLLAASSEYIATLNDHLMVLEPLIQSPDAVNGVLSEDDIHLFASLRSMSIVSGIVYPPAVESYRLRMAERTGIELHDGIAV